MHTSHGATGDAARKSGDAMSKALLAGCVLLVAGSGYAALSECMDGQHAPPREGGVGAGAQSSGLDGAADAASGGGVSGGLEARALKHPEGHHRGRPHHGGRGGRHGNRTDDEQPPRFGDDANRTRDDEPPQRRGKPHAVADEQPPQRPDFAGRPEFGGNRTDAEQPPRFGDDANRTRDDEPPQRRGKPHAVGADASADGADLEQPPRMGGGGARPNLDADDEEPPKRADDSRDSGRSCDASQAPPVRPLAVVAAATGVTGAASVVFELGRHAAFAVMGALVMEAIALVATVAPAFARDGAFAAPAWVGAATLAAAVIVATTCRCLAVVSGAGGAVMPVAGALQPRAVGACDEPAGCDDPDTSCAVDVKPHVPGVVDGVPIGF